MHADWCSLPRSYHNLPNWAPSCYMDWYDLIKEPSPDPTIQKQKNTSSAILYSHLISTICSIMHNEKVIIASSLTKVECAVLLAFGSTAGIPWGRWTRKWSSFNTTQLCECLLSLKALFFPSFLMNSAQTQHSGEQTRHFYNPLTINLSWFFGVYTGNRCGNNSFSLN